MDGVPITVPQKLVLIYPVLQYHECICVKCPSEGTDTIQRQNVPQIS